MDTVAVDAEPVAGTRSRRIPRASLAILARVLGIYLGSRLLQLGFIGWLASPSGPSLKTRLLFWDGTWFVRVATDGYPHGYSYDESGAMVGNGLAFFPGYPLLIRGVHALGPDPGWAAIGISFLAAGAAAVLLFLLGRDMAGDARGAGPRSPAGDARGAGPRSPAGDARGAGPRSPAGERVGYALVVLFCAQPMSVVLSMGYSEATFCALVLGTLLAAYRRRWLTAGGLGLAASLTRPMGLAVAVALAVAAGMALYEQRFVTGGAPRRSAPWRPVVASLVALAGVPAYLVWVGLRVGQLGAWFTVETSGWGTTTDWGRSTVEFVLDALRAGTGWIQVSVALLLIASLACVGLAVRRGVWPPLTVYGLLAYGLVVGQAGYYHSKPRLLVPVLLTLVPAAYLVARSRTRGAILGLAGYAAFGLWFGAYMITVWPYAI